MARESAADKSARLLVEGRLTVTRVGPVIEATCRGSGQLHRLGFDGRAWWCSCEARSRACTHILTLQTVILIEAQPMGGTP